MADTSNSVLFDAPGPKGRRTIRIVNWIAGILFAVVLVLILMRLHNPPDGENQLSWELWKPAVEREAWTDFYLPGLWMTIKATIVAVVGAVVFGLVFGVGRLLPNPLLVWAGYRTSSSVDFVTSNIRAAPFDLYLAGALMEGNYPIGPLAGAAFNLTTMSYRGNLNMGLVTDTAAVGEPELLAKCLDRAYRRLIDAAAP